MADEAKPTTSYTDEAKYTPEGRSARFGEAKFGKARFGARDDFVREAMPTTSFSDEALPT